MYNLAKPNEVSQLYRFYSIIQSSRHTNVRFEVGEDLERIESFINNSFKLLFSLIADFPQTLPARLCERRATFYKMHHEVRDYYYYVYGKKDINWKFTRKSNKDIRSYVTSAIH